MGGVPAQTSLHFSLRWESQTRDSHPFPLHLLHSDGSLKGQPRVNLLVSLSELCPLPSSIAGFQASSPMTFHTSLLHSCRLNNYLCAGSQALPTRLQASWWNCRIPWSSWAWKPFHVPHFLFAGNSSNLYDLP